MYKIAQAMQLIDDDLLLDAIYTIGANRRVKSGGATTVRWKPLSKGKGGAKTKVIAITCCVLAVIIAVSIWAAVVLTGSQVIDNYRIGDEKILDSFYTVSDIYPDEEMAERLSIFDNLLRDIDDKNCYENYDVSLYYNEGTDWQDSDNWYSLIFSGYTGEKEYTTEGGVIYQHVTLMCLFTGTLDKWEIANSFVKLVKNVVIGGIEVHLRYAKNVSTWYAFFEKNEIVYDLRIQFADPTEEQMIEYLDLLLS